MRYAARTVFPAPGMPCIQMARDRKPIHSVHSGNGEPNLPFPLHRDFWRRYGSVKDQFSRANYKSQAAVKLSPLLVLKCLRGMIEQGSENKYLSMHARHY